MSQRRSLPDSYLLPDSSGSNMPLSQDVKVILISILCSLALAAISAGVGFSLRKTRTPKDYNVTVRFSEVTPANTPSVISMKLNFMGSDEYKRFTILNNETLAANMQVNGTFATVPTVDQITKYTLLLEGFTRPEVGFQARLTDVRVIPIYLSDEEAVKKETLLLCPRRGEDVIVKNGWRILQPCGNVT